MALEITLRELESFGLSRDPENYAPALYGMPREGGWGWRVEGHHPSLHVSLEADRYVATLPQFFGANPAVVPRDVAGGLRVGFRLLGIEEDTARQWLVSLSDVQRQVAVIDKRPYGDILSRNAPRARPLDDVGLAFGDMNPTQQALLLKLVATFADHLQPELTQARLARVRAAPLDTIRMAWAGSTMPREPHYFSIQGSSFLIEFDNSGGNHIHSVWRDFEGDFGRDMLREHYRRSPLGMGSADRRRFTVAVEAPGSRRLTLVLGQLYRKHSEGPTDVFGSRAATARSMLVDRCMAQSRRSEYDSSASSDVSDRTQACATFARVLYALPSASMHLAG